MPYKDKASEIKETMKAMAPNPSGLDQLEQDAEEKTCSWCGKKITSFRDGISEQEYQISGFCQKCQDETFGV